jgi:hypothetical protein
MEKNKNVTKNITKINNDNVNINTFKKYIRDNVFELNKENKINIYIFLKNKMIDDHIIQNADGVRIDLNNLSDNLIIELYNLIKYKINEDKKK